MLITNLRHCDLAHALPANGLGHNHPCMQDREKEKLRECGRRKLEEYRLRKAQSAATARTLAAASGSQVPVPPVVTGPSLSRSSSQPQLHACTEASPRTPSLSRHSSYNQLTPPYPAGPGSNISASFSPTHSSLAVAAVRAGPEHVEAEVAAHARYDPAAYSPMQMHQQLLREMLGGASLTSHSRDPAAGCGECSAVCGEVRDQALVEILLSQVEALMREKATLQCTVSALQHENDSLHELVGYLAEHQAPSVPSSYERMRCGSPPSSPVAVLTGPTAASAPMLIRGDDLARAKHLAPAEAEYEGLFESGSFKEFVVNTACDPSATPRAWSVAVEGGLSEALGASMDVGMTRAPGSASSSSSSLPSRSGSAIAIMG